MIRHVEGCHRLPWPRSRFGVCNFVSRFQEPLDLLIRRDFLVAVLAAGYRSRRVADGCPRVGLHHFYTRPHTPRISG